jgi:heterodisulfide reductase subunit B
MVFSYFPGCTLKTSAQNLDRCARLSAQALGFTLEEIPDWQCCGGAYPLATDEVATKLSSIRALMAAREAGQDLLTLCSACHNVIKQVNRDMREDAQTRAKVNAYLEPKTPYGGETRVVHYLEALRDTIGFDNVKKAVKHPLSGKRVGAYYGCLLLRPASTMRMDDPESPSILEDFIRALGAEPVMYGMRNECCGGYASVENPDQARAKSRRVLDSAAGAGAEILVSACPLCRYNLNRAADSSMPQTLYFTELLAQALGVDAVEGGEPDARA